MSMIRKVTAYEDSNGDLYKTREEVIYSEINMLFHEKVTHSEVQRIVTHRAEIAAILNMVDG